MAAGRVNPVADGCARYPVRVSGLMFGALNFLSADPAECQAAFDRLEVLLRAARHLAEQYEVDVAFENCPMYHTWPWVHNIAVSPAMWRSLFDVMGSPRVGLNFDPSHLVWQRIDYLSAVDEFADRIKIVQAQDTEIMTDVQRVEGMLSLRWWRHRIPGEGMIDWSTFIQRLRLAGYDAVLSIEHEDPVYEGSEERVLQGLWRTRAHLDPLL